MFFSILFSIESLKKTTEQRKKTPTKLLQFLLHVAVYKQMTRTALFMVLLLSNSWALGSLCTQCLRKRLLVQTLVLQCMLSFNQENKAQHTYTQTHKNLTTEQRKSSSAHEKKTHQQQRNENRCFFVIKVHVFLGMCAFCFVQTGAYVHFASHWFIIFYFIFIPFGFVTAQWFSPFAIVVLFFSLSLSTSSTLHCRLDNSFWLIYWSTVRFVKLILTLCHSELNLITLFILQMDLLHSNSWIWPVFGLVVKKKYPEKQ